MTVRQLNPIGEVAMREHARALRDRLMLAGLIGAGLATVGWWTLIAAGAWRALEWGAA